MNDYLNRARALSGEQDYDSVYDVAFALLRHHAADIGFVGLEVVRHLPRLVTLLAVLEHRRALDFFFDGVIDACGVNGGTVHLHAHKLRREVHLLVLQVTRAVEERRAVAQHHQRVFRLVLYRRIDGATASGALRILFLCL